MPEWWARSDALRDVLVEIGRMPPPQRRFDLSEIQPGWQVFDRELEPVGRVEGVVGRYVTVRRSYWGLYLWQRLYVPESAIGETHEGSVLLNVPREWIGTMGWGHPPREARRGILPDMPADSSSTRVAAASSAAASPLIVVAVGDPQLAENPELAAYKNELYAAGISRHGGTAALLHASVQLDERKRLLGAMAGLLLSGGADLEPALYGETPQGAAGIDPLRDEFEVAAWRKADRRGVPVLGICRGLQAINVFLGGALLQDVPSHSGTPYGHGPAQMHPIDIERETILGRALGGGSSADVGAGAAEERLALTVNTFHHQAVREDLLASSLRPAAWADSEFGRLVEGFEGTGDRWLVAVQCHPERLDSTPTDFERLWEAFVQAARDFAATSPRETAATPIG